MHARAKFEIVPRTVVLRIIRLTQHSSSKGKGVKWVFTTSINSSSLLYRRIVALVGIRYSCASRIVIIVIDIFKCRST